MRPLRPILVVPGWTLLLFLGALLGAGLFLIDAGSLPLQEPRPATFRVLIDPGHGGIDSGCHWGDLFEKDLTLDMAFSLKNRLEAVHIPAILTRSTDDDLDPLEPNIRGRHQRDLQARAHLAREVGADILVSIHVNAAGSEHLSGGMVFYQPHLPESRRLAAHIQAELQKVLPGNQNGILPGNFYLLRHVPYPTVLVEAGFLTGAADRERLSSPSGRQAIAEAIAAGIIAYHAGHATPSVPERPTLMPAVEWPRFEPGQHGDEARCGA